MVCREQHSNQAMHLGTGIPDPALITLHLRCDQGTRGAEGYPGSCASTNEPVNPLRETHCKTHCTSGPQRPAGLAGSPPRLSGRLRRWAPGRLTVGRRVASYARDWDRPPPRLRARMRPAYSVRGLMTMDDGRVWRCRLAGTAPCSRQRWAELCAVRGGHRMSHLVNHISYPGPSLFALGGVLALGAEMES